MTQSALSAVQFSSAQLPHTEKNSLVGVLSSILIMRECQIESVVAFHASNDGGYEKNKFSRQGEGTAALCAATVFANNARGVERRELLVHCVEECTWELIVVHKRGRKFI